ncbi:tripartite tricarboxylate transporter substrate binding protein [soil metagenome]
MSKIPQTPRDLERRRLTLGLAAAVPVALMPQFAWASFPDKQIKLIVPYSAGGGTDAIGRQLAQRLSPALGQNVIVDNRPGADGMIGTDMCAKAAPDGSTLVLVMASHLINPLVIAKMPFDTLKDLVGVTMVAAGPLGFFVGPDVPASNMKELLALIKKTPGKYSYGSSESMTRLVGAMYIEGQKLDAVSIPYKGSAPLINDVAAGMTTIAVSSVVSAKALTVAGRLKCLAVTGPERSALLPDVPTMTEQGFPAFEQVRTTYSLFAPAATPPATLERLNKEIATILQMPDMKKFLADQSAYPVGNTVHDFNEQVKQESQFWGGLAKMINLKPE